MSGPQEAIAAIRAGDADRLRALITQEPSLAGARDEAGVSAVLHARYRLRKDLLEILLAANPDLDIFEAAAVGEAERVEELLKQDPGLVRAWSADGFTALHLACYFRQEPIVRSLLEHGADTALAAKNSTKVTPLHSAAASRQATIVKMLLEHGAPVNAQQQGGWTALHSAAHQEDLEMATLLLKYGAAPMIKNDDGRTAADMADEKGNRLLGARLRQATNA